MDIERTSMALASANTLRSFGIGMMRQSMDQVEEMGAMMAEMIQNMPTPSVAPQSSESTINVLI